MSETLLDKLAMRYHINLMKNKDGSLDYLLKRGLTKKTIQHFKLGYCEKNIGYNFFKNKYTKKELLDSGIFIEKNNWVIDLFNNRITIPTIIDGSVKLFTSRSLVKGAHTPHLHQILEHGIKYLFNQNVIKNKKIIIVESPIDAMTLHQNKFPAVATFGTNGGIHNVGNKLYKKKVYIAYDNDPNEAGQLGALKLAERLYKKRIISYIITLPTDKDKVDVNSFFKKYDSKAFIKLINEAEKYSNTDFFKEQRTVKRFKNKINFDYPIELVVKEFLPEATPTNYGFKCSCPFHGDSNPSFAIYTKTNKFHCFGIGCEAHGNSVALYQMLQNNKGRSLTYKDALKELANSVR